MIPFCLSPSPSFQPHEKKNPNPNQKNSQTLTISSNELATITVTMQKMKKTIEGTGTEIFICFTSRPSAASTTASAAAAMGVPSSKTLTSPSRSSAPTPSLSSSLSRRLRSSGSLKSAGAQSPMFPSVTISGSRKKGCAFEVAEPSSPKVTCIGQVRVKSKRKKIKNAVSRSRSVRSGADSSFRRNQESRRTKAVSICDAFSCFVPCCTSSETTKREKRGRSSPSCGAVFARWLMAIQEDEEEEVKANEFVREFVFRKREVEIEVFEKKKEAEVVVVEEEETDEMEVMEEEEKARVSVCVPPRNALLLMRCRSDPVRMAELATRFWDSPAMRVECQEEAQIVENEEEVVDECNADEVEETKVVVDEEKLEHEVEEEKTVVAEEEVEKEMLGEVISGEEVDKVVKEVEESTNVAIDEVKEEESIDVQRGEELEIVLRRSISCSAAKSNDLSKVKRRSFSYREKKEKRRHSFLVEREDRRHSFCSEKEARRSSFSVEKENKGRWSFSVEKENMGPKEKAKPVAQSRVQAKEEEMPVAMAGPVKAVEPKIVIEESNNQVVSVVSKVEEVQVPGVEREKKGRELPDCLLLMMYEPKLSMEVSKETWVCSTDFLHWRPNYTQQTNQLPKSNANANSNTSANANVGESNKAEEDKFVENKSAISVTTENSEAIAPQTPKKPATEHKKAQKSSAVGPLQQSPYEHFVLTRCKSEPVKSSARLAPDAWFWKSRHQPISTAGIGF